MQNQNRKVTENIKEITELYKELFFNLKSDVAHQIYRHWLDKPGWGYEPFKLDGQLTTVIENHLKGVKTIGMYSHSVSGTSKWACFDVDVKEGLFADRMEKASLALGAIKQRVLDLGVPAEALLTDFSGGKGYHLWVNDRRISDGGGSELYPPCRSRTTKTPI